MGVTTSQQITRYYDTFRDTEIVFSKEIIRTIHLNPRQVFIKCAGVQWPCIINSTSLLGARIILGTKGGAYANISKNNSTVSLRFCFSQPDGEDISFFVTARVTDIAPYMDSNELAIISISFTQRPPDNLIEIIGKLLEARANAERRSEERIPISPDTKRRLNLLKEETIVYIQNVPRHCIVRNLSFSGSKIILQGLAQYLLNKDADLHLEFDEPRETISLKGKVVSTESIEGRKDLITVSIQFNTDTVSMNYKLHINSCLTSLRKKQLTITEDKDSNDTEKNKSQQTSNQQIENSTKENQTEPSEETSPDEQINTQE